MPSIHRSRGIGIVTVVFGLRIDRQDLDRVGQVGPVVAGAAVADHQHVDAVAPVQRTEELGRRERGARDGRIEGRGPHAEQDAADDHGQQRQQQDVADRPQERASAPARVRRGVTRLRGALACVPPLPSPRGAAGTDQVAVVRRVVVASRGVSGHVDLMLWLGWVALGGNRIGLLPF